MGLLKVQLVVALISLALAGCSGEATTDGAPTPPLERGKYTIHLVSGNVFLPANASVPVGATVIWIADAGEHDVTEGGGANGTWSSDHVGQKLTRGDRYERQFTEPAVVRYRCTLHESEGMVGTLTVGAGSA